MKRYHWYRDGMWEDSMPLPGDPSPTKGKWYSAEEVDAMQNESKIPHDVLVECLATLRAIDNGHGAVIAGTLRPLCNRIVAAMDILEEKDEHPFGHPPCEKCGYTWWKEDASGKATCLRCQGVIGFASDPALEKKP